MALRCLPSDTRSVDKISKSRRGLGYMLTKDFLTASQGSLLVASDIFAHSFALFLNPAPGNQFGTYFTLHNIRKPPRIEQ